MYVDIGQVSEFQSITDHLDSVEFGASVTLSCLGDYLMQKSNQSVTFEPIASHVKHVASKPIRNVAYRLLYLYFLLKNLVCIGALLEEKPPKELETAKIKSVMVNTRKAVEGLKNCDDHFSKTFE